MTFAQREKQAQERLARHSAKNRQRIEALSKAEQDALAQKAAENRAKLLPTTQKAITLTLTKEQADILICGLREIYLYENEYFNEFKEQASDLAGMVREAMYEA
jgi:hypothetical protein